MTRRGAWVENLFQPLTIAGMLGCIVLSLVDLIRLFAPSWNGTFLVVGCALAGLEAHYSYRLIRVKEIRGTDVTRFRAVEIAMLFVLLKAGSYIGDRWSDVLADVLIWPLDPLNTLLNPETVVAFILAFLSWSVSTQTVRDLERIGDPPPRGRGYIPPRDSIAHRFFSGGTLLLILAGITRIGIAALTNLSRPPVPGLVLNVLVYFLLGLAMLGQIHFTTSQRQWEAQKMTVATRLAGRWAGYSLVLISLAALVAFLLPTGYTIGLLDIVAAIIYTLGYVLTLLNLLLWFILSILLTPLALLFGREPPPRPSVPPPLKFPSPGMSTPGASGTAPTWLELLRSLLFWAAAVTMVTYVTRSYLRDHPELVDAFVSLRPIHALRNFLLALWRQLIGLAEVINERIPLRVSVRRTRTQSSDSPFRFFRLGALSPRERILYYYLSILRRASQLGLPRKRTQTPHEYDKALKDHLEQAQQEMTHLTQSFVEARYSRHTFDRRQDSQVRANWQQVKAALRALKRRAQTGSSNPSDRTSTD